MRNNYFPVYSNQRQSFTRSWWWLQILNRMQWKKRLWLILRCKLGTCLITTTEDKSSRSLAWYEEREPTRGYTMVLLNLRLAQHVSGTIMPIIRSLRLHRCSQHVAHNLGYSRLCVRVEGCCSSNIPQPGLITYSLASDQRPAITKVVCHML